MKSRIAVGAVLLSLALACGGTEIVPVDGPGGAGGSGGTGGTGGTGGLGGTGGNAPSRVAQVVVAAHPGESCPGACQSVRTGATRRLVAVAFDAAGTQLDDVAFGWSSSDEATATVDGDGLVQALRVGWVEIAAEAEGTRGGFALQVLPAPIARLEIRPARAVVASGGAVTFEVDAFDDAGSPVPAPRLGWTLSNPLVASIDGTGTATGVGPGQTVVVVGSPDGGAARAVLEVDPEVALPPGRVLADLALGANHGCGLEPDGTAVCWGENGAGQLGGGTRDPDGFATRPQQVEGGRRFTGVVAGQRHGCALDDDGTAWCWGANGAGQLGIGAASDYEPAPVPVPVPWPLAQLAPGARHTCGILAPKGGEDGGPAWCWGHHGDGQLGIGPDERAVVPAPAPLHDGRTWAMLAAGDTSTCGLDDGGRAFCWGRNGAGQVGVSDLHSHLDVLPLPQPVVTEHRFVQLALHDAHVCGVDTAGGVHCWGRNDHGQVAADDAESRGLPVPMELPAPALEVAVGTRHSCALVLGGSVWCWGDNRMGQLGNGTADTSPAPVQVESPVAFESLRAGGEATCGRTATGESWCWGRSARGEIGGGFGGQGTFSAVPWPVATAEGG